ncbi:alpha/beta hydrolase family protein [Polynucleobacter antarcticus]|uniref:Acetylhydrolase n=1 Tax=Polynucleobacter antarcticus TaxID=1743162 RepID=A0A6M9PWP5_9BURK|nr:acetylhydrolase [Polynucleobacter antarcticus]QKM63185.1 acetylhydrolase [Polynucleobacter antarcticus]
MMNQSRRAFLRRAIATSSSIAIPALALHHSPSFGSTDRFSIHDQDWVDPARDRLVPVRLYMPMATENSAPIPLVIFSHGIGGSRLGYTYLGRYWASNGFASMHVQHIGSDRSIWFGNLFSLVSRLQEAAQEQEAIARTNDLRFALTRLLDSPLGGAIDSKNVIVAGHSYGSNTALLTSGARVHRNGAPMDLRDPRITAAILISTPPFYGQTALSTILESVAIPTLHVTATEDTIRIPGYYSGYEDRLAIFDAIGSKTKSLVVFEGGTHSIFTDRTNTGGAVLNQQIKEATQELSLGFLKQITRKQDSDILDWSERHKAILFKVVA